MLVRLVCRGKFATVRQKYGKCRTSVGTPQMILFQDVECGCFGEEPSKSGTLSFRVVALKLTWKTNSCVFPFFMAHSSARESKSSLLPNLQPLWGNILIYNQRLLNNFLNLAIMWCTVSTPY